MSNKMTALYARSAANNPEHITQQMNDLVTFAHSNHFANLCHFTDDGYSAFDNERPGLTGLRNAILAKEIGTVMQMHGLLMLLCRKHIRHTTPTMLRCTPLLRRC